MNISNIAAALNNSSIVTDDSVREVFRQILLHLQENDRRLEHIDKFLSSMKADTEKPKAPKTPTKPNKKKIVAVEEPVTNTQELLNEQE